MSDRRLAVLFYGLFMDFEVLRGNRIEPSDSRRGYVDGYALRIGQRATLLPAVGARAYGLICWLTDDELERLYSPPSLAPYRPEAVLAHTFDGQQVAALCYTLKEAPGAEEANLEYAQELRAALRKLKFPADYIAEVP